MADGHIERSLQIRIVSPEDNPDEILFVEVIGTMPEQERRETYPDEATIMKMLVVVDLLLALMGDPDTPKRNSGRWN